MHLLGIDLGSSSVKLSLVDASTGKVVQASRYPDNEMSIVSDKPGWAEQDPEIWWQSFCKALDILLTESGVSAGSIEGIGIAYQMHGLVLVDVKGEVLRPAIIWCDSRAVDQGNQALERLGHDYCYNNLLNAPGNFTASKLAWVQQNEPHIYSRIYKIMLPGDYLAWRLTGDINTTITGLSEAVCWNYRSRSVDRKLIDALGLELDHFPEYGESFAVSGTVSSSVAEATGLAKGTALAYRSGDQPHKALALGAYKEGDVVATGGTSAVVYAVSHEMIGDPQSRINTFAHVNYRLTDPVYGMLMCINGAGICYAWMKRVLMGNSLNYQEMENLVRSIDPGAEGLRMIPFGNGAERILHNLDTGAQINNLNFIRHDKAHILRAALEGIAYSIVHGILIFRELGLNIKRIRTGNDNLFRSESFCKIIAGLTDVRIEVCNSNGAYGAALGAGLGLGVFSDIAIAVRAVETVEIYEDCQDTRQISSFEDWCRDLDHLKRKINRK